MNNKILNIGLWVVQVLLAILFLMAGITKLTSPVENLPYPWMKEVPELMVRLLGIVEILGGIGIFLPSMLRIKPQLAIFATLGMIFLMISAIIFHVMRGESAVIGFNFIVIALAGFVYWGRSKKVVILPKQ